MKKILFVLSVFIFISAGVSKFPTLNCETLNGKKVAIPDDVKGKKSETTFQKFEVPKVGPFLKGQVN